jgi:uncharacterized protein (TIGR03382 family)
VKYSAEVSAAIARWGPAYGVTIDPALVHAIIEKESSHGRALVTDEGGGRFSYGPMMVLDSTARGLGVRSPATLKDPATGIWYGVKYLAGLLRQFPGDVARAVASYNAGPSAPDAAGHYKNQPYVDRVLAFWRRFRGVAVASAPAAGLLAVGVLVLLLLSRRRRAIAF